MTNSGNLPKGKTHWVMTLLATGIVSSVITSIFALIISVNTNHTLEGIEKFKANNQVVELQIQRINELYREKILEIKNSFLLKEFDIIKPLGIFTEICRNVNKSQRENTAKTLLDLSKAIVIAFGIGGLIPNSPVTPIQIVWAVIIAILFYITAMLILRGEDG